MNQQNINFCVEQQYGVTKFTNNSDMMLEISVVPKKPRRSYTTIFLIPPGQFFISEENMIVISNLSFRLLPKESYERNQVC